MNRLEFLGSIVLWGALFYLSSFCVILAIGYNQLGLFALFIIPTIYTFFKLLQSGYKRVMDIFPGRDLGIILIGFIVIISIVPFGTFLLLLLPGNLVKPKDKEVIDE